MKSIKEFSSKTGKVFLYSSNVIFKNYKSYLSTILLPMIVTFVIFIIRVNAGGSVNVYNFPLFFLIPSIVLIFFFSSVLLDWRKSTFIKQMTNFGVNKYSFILGFTLTTFVCSIMATACGIAYMYLFSLIPSKEGNLFNQWAEFVTSGLQVLGLIIAIIFSSILTSFIALLFTGYLKNIYIIQTANTLMIALFLVFSDIMIPAQYTSGSTAICIIGYFDPYKYMSWSALMFNSKMNIDSFYVYFFITNLDNYVSFKDIWQPIIGAIGWTAVVCAVSSMLFKSSTKK